MTHITLPKEVAQQVLDALDYIDSENASQEAINRSSQASNALRQHIEAAREVEPVFWYRPRSDGMYEGPLHNAQIERVRKESGGWVPLHPHPAPQPKAEPVLCPKCSVDYLLDPAQQKAEPATKENS